jgi:hypothetical protein
VWKIIVICSETNARPVVKCEFDGATRDGREIVIHVSIGDAREFAKKYPGPDPGFYVEVEPLVGRRSSVGTDSFMAMCFGIELVRKALRIFVANGGSVYFRGTRSPIDLESYWFQSLGLLLRPEFLLPDPISPKPRLKKKPRTGRRSASRVRGNA